MDKANNFADIIGVWYLTQFYSSPLHHLLRTGEKSPNPLLTKYRLQCIPSLRFIILPIKVYHTTTSSVALYTKTSGLGETLGPMLREYRLVTICRSEFTQSRAHFFVQIYCIVVH